MAVPRPLPENRPVLNRPMARPIQAKPVLEPLGLQGQRKSTPVGAKVPSARVLQGLLFGKILPHIPMGFTVRQEYSPTYQTRYIAVYSGDMNTHLSFYPANTAEDPWNKMRVANQGTAVKDWAGMGWQTDASQISTLDFSDFHYSNKRTSRNVHIHFNTSGEVIQDGRLNQGERRDADALKDMVLQAIAEAQREADERAIAAYYARERYMAEILKNTPF